MLYDYRLTVMFKDKTAGKDTKIDYYSFLQEHSAIGFEDSDRNVSIVHFNSRERLSEKLVREELKSAKLVKFEEKRRKIF